MSGWMLEARSQDLRSPVTFIEERRHVCTEILIDSTFGWSSGAILNWLATYSC